MKTFISAARLLVVALLFVSLNAFGAGCCATKCAPKCEKQTNCCAAPACRLKPEPVEIVKTCDHPGFYRQVCRLEYRPCEGKVTRHKACPVYEGCFSEDGSVLEVANQNGKSGVAHTQNATVEVIAPQFGSDVTYVGADRKSNGRAAYRKNGKMNKAAVVEDAVIIE